MKPVQLLAQFDRISDAPDAIPRLRRFILDLAVCGKLVNQDPRDEPAFELLTRIQKEKARRIKDGNLREQKPLPLAKEEQADFELPNGWQWVRMADVIKLWNGYAFKSADFQSKGVPVIRIGDLQAGEVVLSNAVCVSEATANNVGAEVWIPAGALLIAMSGATTGKVAFNLTGVRLLLNQRVGRIEVFLMSTHFIRFFFDTIVARNLSISFGTAIPNLSTQQINETIVPLPPLAEQHRIVAKVDELMALCDRLEAAQAERESRRDRLVASSLNRLNNGADPDAFRSHARFYFNQLQRLTTRHEHVKKLRGAILNLAFRGWLTSPWRETAEFVGTAQEFRLSVENARKNAWDKKQVAGSTRKYLFPIEFDRENLPTIPDSWVWASADAVCSQITDGEHIQPCYQPEGLPMLTAKHVREGFVTFEDSELISESDFKKCVARCKPEEGDILVVSVGATTGRAAIVSQSRPFALVRSVLLLKPLISPAYFLRWLQSPWCFVWMRQASEASAQPHLYIGDTRRMPVPLPPLAEQQRIVAKVDELMAVCDRLEAQLTTTQTESHRLLEAVLAELLQYDVAPMGG